jgi:hypothetical protein
LPKLFRSLAETGHCSFEVIGRVPQLSPIKSTARKQRIELKGIPTKDEELGLAARRFLQRSENHFVVLIDDLEEERAAEAAAIFRRYRTALDMLLDPLGLAWRASVHFFVNMLEAYYFADTAATNHVLGTGLQDYAGDVESIRHPKNLLKSEHRGFDEVKDGAEIVASLDLRKVLSRPDTCASLRSLVRWCVKAVGEPCTDEYCLINGIYQPLTQPQADVMEERLWGAAGGNE